MFMCIYKIRYETIKMFVIFVIYFMFTWISHIHLYSARLGDSVI